ncbi:MAG: hypothetical protein PF508_10385 [Spirochaeta sp.]|nr:hypothetical protein [Spirochaeta sp.]
MEKEIHPTDRGGEQIALLTEEPQVDQVFIRLAENVRPAVLVAEIKRRKVFDQVFEERVRQAILIGPLGVTEFAVQGIRIGLLDTAHRLLKRMTDTGALGSGVLPVTTLRNLEPVVLRELGKLNVTIRFLKGSRILLVIDIGDPLEE